MEPQIQYATTPNGANIAYCSVGEGIPLVIAVSPTFSHLVAMWQFEEPERLADAGFRVVRFDWRCTGSSDRTPIDFSLNAMIEAIEAVVEVAVPNERFALFGRAAGCYGAVGYAAKHPERLLHLFLEAPIGDGRVAYESLAMNKGLESLRQFGDDHWDAYIRATLGLGLAPPELTERLVAVMREAMTPEAGRAWYETLPNLSLSSLLPDLKVPTLVFVMPDSAAPAPLQRALAARIAGAKAVTIDGRSSPRLRRRTINIMRETFSLPVTNERAKSPPPAPVLKAERPHLKRSGAFRTILFTDIVGHTEMMQRLGDAKGRDVLREHERITRETLKTHGGAEVKTMGDGFMASFGSVTSAMECAIALQRAFAAHTESMPEPLHVRVGLNAGEPIEEDGDLFGATVILASRIAAKASAGEILIPELLCHLLSGKSYVYADRGETFLKGFEDAVRLYEVRWQD